MSITVESIIERNALQPVDHVGGAPRWPFRPSVLRTQRSEFTKRYDTFVLEAKAVLVVKI